MRALLQRVHSATYTRDGHQEKIGRGYLILLGVAQGDTADSARILADKVSLVRAYQNKDGQWDAHLRDIRGEILVVPSPDIISRCIRGRRPIYNAVAEDKVTVELTAAFSSHFTALGLRAVYIPQCDGAQIDAALDGPTAFIIDTVDL